MNSDDNNEKNPSKSFVESSCNRQSLGDNNNNVTGRTVNSNNNNDDNTDISSDFINNTCRFRLRRSNNAISSIDSSKNNINNGNIINRNNNRITNKRRLARRLPNTLRRNLRRSCGSYSSDEEDGEEELKVKVCEMGGKKDNKEEKTKSEYNNHKENVNDVLKTISTSSEVFSSFRSEPRGFDQNSKTSIRNYSDNTTEEDSDFSYLYDDNDLCDKNVNIKYKNDIQSEEKNKDFVRSKKKHRNKSPRVTRKVEKGRNFSANSDVSDKIKYRKKRNINNSSSEDDDKSHGAKGENDNSNEVNNDIETRSSSESEIITDTMSSDDDSGTETNTETDSDSSISSGSRGSDSTNSDSLSSGDNNAFDIILGDTYLEGLDCTDVAKYEQEIMRFIYANNTKKFSDRTIIVRYFAYMVSNIIMLEKDVNKLETDITELKRYLPTSSTSTAINEEKSGVNDDSTSELQLKQQLLDKRTVKLLHFWSMLGRVLHSFFMYTIDEYSKSLDYGSRNTFEAMCRILLSKEEFIDIIDTYIVAGDMNKDVPKMASYCAYIIGEGSRQPMFGDSLNERFFEVFIEYNNNRRNYINNRMNVDSNLVNSTNICSNSYNCNNNIDHSKYRRIVALSSLISMLEKEETTSSKNKIIEEVLQSDIPSFLINRYVDLIPKIIISIIYTLCFNECPEQLLEIDKILKKIRHSIAVSNSNTSSTISSSNSSYLAPSINDNNISVLFESCFQFFHLRFIQEQNKNQFVENNVKEVNKFITTPRFASNNRIENSNDSGLVIDAPFFTNNNVSSDSISQYRSFESSSTSLTSFIEADFRVIQSECSNDTFFWEPKAGDLVAEGPNCPADLYPNKGSTKGVVISVLSCDDNSAELRINNKKGCMLLSSLSDSHSDHASFNKVATRVDDNNIFSQNYSKNKNLSLAKKRFDNSEFNNNDNNFNNKGYQVFVKWLDETKEKKTSNVINPKEDNKNEDINAILNSSLDFRKENIKDVYHLPRYKCSTFENRQIVQYSEMEQIIHLNLLDSYTDYDEICLISALIGTLGIKANLAALLIEYRIIELMVIFLQLHPFISILESQIKQKQIKLSNMCSQYNINSFQYCLDYLQPFEIKDPVVKFRALREILSRNLWVINSAIVHKALGKKFINLDGDLALFDFAEHSSRSLSSVETIAPSTPLISYLHPISNTSSLSPSSPQLSIATHLYGCALIMSELARESNIRELHQKHQNYLPKMMLSLAFEMFKSNNCDVKIAVSAFLYRALGCTIFLQHFDSQSCIDKIAISVLQEKTVENGYEDSNEDKDIFKRLAKKRPMLIALLKVIFIYFSTHLFLIFQKINNYLQSLSTPEGNMSNINLNCFLISNKFDQQGESTLLFVPRDEKKVDSIIELLLTQYFLNSNLKSYLFSHNTWARFTYLVDKFSFHHKLLALANSEKSKSAQIISLNVLYLLSLPPSSRITIAKSIIPADVSLTIDSLIEKKSGITVILDLIEKNNFLKEGGISKFSLLANEKALKILSLFLYPSDFSLYSGENNSNFNVISYNCNDYHNDASTIINEKVSPQLLHPNSPKVSFRKEDTNNIFGNSPNLNKPANRDNNSIYNANSSETTAVKDYNDICQELRHHGGLRVLLGIKVPSGNNSIFTSSNLIELQFRFFALYLYVLSLLYFYHPDTRLILRNLSIEKHVKTIKNFFEEFIPRMVTIDRALTNRFVNNCRLLMGTYNSYNNNGNNNRLISITNNNNNKYYTNDHFGPNSNEYNSLHSQNQLKAFVDINSSNNDTLNYTRNSLLELIAQHLENENLNQSAALLRREASLQSTMINSTKSNGYYQHRNISLGDVTKARQIKENPESIVQTPERANLLEFNFKNEPLSENIFNSVDINNITGFLNQPSIMDNININALTNLSDDEDSDVFTLSFPASNQSSLTYTSGSLVSINGENNNFFTNNNSNNISLAKIVRSYLNYRYGSDLPSLSTMPSIDLCNPDSDMLDLKNIVFNKQNVNDNIINYSYGIINDSTSSQQRLLSMLKNRKISFEAYNNSYDSYQRFLHRNHRISFEIQNDINDSFDSSVVSFFDRGQRFIVGTSIGSLAVYDLEGKLEGNHAVFEENDVTFVDVTDSLVVAINDYKRGKILKLKEPEGFAQLITFENAKSAKFSSNECLLAITGDKDVKIMDVETGTFLQTIQRYSDEAINKMDIANFDKTGNLIITNATLWDIRSCGRPIYKFDSLSHDFSSIFHPTSIYAVIDGHIWDLRMLKITNSCSYLQQTMPQYGSIGTFFYAPVVPDDDTMFSTTLNIVHTGTYELVSSHEMKDNMLDFALDVFNEEYFATIHETEDTNKVLRVHQIGVEPGEVDAENAEANEGDNFWDEEGDDSYSSLFNTSSDSDDDEDDSTDIEEDFSDISL